MKTTIKIRDTKWFQENCKVISKTEYYDELIPKYPSWEDKSAITWLSGNTSDMGVMEGCALEVELDSGILGRCMSSSRYMVNGYWIPNWAIEWVKEENK